MRKPDLLPLNCVYMLAKTDHQGRIALARIPARRPTLPGTTGVQVPEEDRYWTVAEEIRLVASDPDGGFAPYKPREGRPYALVVRDMKEAPKDGYVRELVVHRDTMKNLGNPRDEENRRVFFYFKTFGRCGKGDFGGVTAQPDGSSVSGHLEIRIQSDRSRNLEGHEGWERDDDE